MVIPGIYAHYKDQSHQYRVIGTALHSETLEALVVYEALYDNPKSKLWARPVAMFTGTVIHNGVEVPRFSYVGPETS
jgi:hypothetical protein